VRILLKSRIQLCVFGFTDASVAKLIELIKVRQLDFELQSRPTSVSPRRVKTTASVTVRKNPSTSARKLGTQPSGALGTITSGPRTGSGYTWWQVNFDTSADGWVIQNYLTASTLAVASSQTNAQLTSANTVPITHTLARGWTGPEVSTLQTMLQKLDHFTAEITGYFGSLTEASVKDFQKQNNLAAVGVVGPKTRGLLAQMSR
jgi:hypothetical protein